MSRRWPWQRNRNGHTPDISEEDRREVVDKVHAALAELNEVIARLPAQEGSGHATSGPDAT